MAANQPIHFAAERGDLAEVQRIITEDPSLVELIGTHDWTPLIRACREGHAAIVKWLIDHAGANIEAQNSFGSTGLFLSSWQGRLDVVSIVLNRGPDFNRASNDGRQPLMVAAGNGKVDVVELLLSQEGIDLDAQDEDGFTAPWIATCHGWDDSLPPLLAAGADPRLADNDGRTPLDIARECENGECIGMLEDALAEPERAPRVLHRARAINDAHHAINKVARETEGMDEEERKREMVAAAPAYLKRRVGEGEMLPQVEMRRRSRRCRNAEEEEQEKLAAVFERMVMDGQVPSEVFVELMEMMIPEWDDERRRV